MVPESETGHSRALGERARISRRKALQARRYYTLTAASTLVPGLGLIRTRRRTGIAILTGFVIALLAALGWMLTKGVTSSVISVGVSRRA